MRAFFILMTLLGAALTGFFLGSRPSKFNSRIFSNQEFPVVLEKPFVVVVYSYKQSKWCETALRSIFEQEYGPFRVVFFDDASEDGTFEKVKSFVLANKEEGRVILIQNSERIGPAGCLYRACQTLSDEEIVVFLDSKDWLAHSNALSRLNAAYQNPDVWIAFSNPILFPSYERARESFVGKAIPSKIGLSFYAALFKQIRYQDLLQGDRFIRGKGGFIEPMLQMADERWKILDEPLLIANESVSRMECSDPSSRKYEALSSFPQTPSSGAL